MRVNVGRLEPATEVSVAAFVAGGDQQHDVVEVRISYGIIDRFSMGLYSSPNKAFEELVSNSYDAGATRVWVSLANDLSAAEASIAVIDDGDSMDLEGLRELWQIGESPKRKDEDLAHLPKHRLPIGKFGIGKLATYVLANSLTFVCCKDGVHRAVTMDYGRVTGRVTEPTTMRLAVAEITRDQAEESLRSIVNDPVAFEVLFGQVPPLSWTAAILTDLKDPARRLRIGRLRWVLSAGLPLSPQFALWMNGEDVPASKAAGKRIWTFTVGDSDRHEQNWPWRERATVLEDKRTAIQFEHAGALVGQAELFEDTLKRGKSEEAGRSHGFFVRVRGRLVNLWDETFGIDVELHHGALTRFRMVVDADGLDQHLSSPRESIQESPALDELRIYLLAVFNRARGARPALDQGDKLALISAVGRIADPSPALSQAPLRRMLQRAVDGDEAVADSLGLASTDQESARQLLSAGQEVLLEKVLIEDLGDDSRLVRYDPKRRAAIVNAQHPFINNYVDQKGASEPLKFVGLAELLTEAFMLDEAIPSSLVQRIMLRRDSFLRALVEQHPRSALVISRRLRESRNHEEELEDAVADALHLLGFSVQRVGGNGAPDGIATARLGMRDQSVGDESYTLTYDAKSSGGGIAEAVLPPSLNEGDTVTTVPSSRGAAGKASGKAAAQARARRIKAATAQTSILRVHREEVKAQHTLLVAPGFQGEDLGDGLLEKVCKNDSITPMRVDDLARLVELFPFRAVSPHSLRPLFTSRTPNQSRAFVEELERTQTPETPPIGHIVDILLHYSGRKNPVTIETLNAAIFERCGRDVGIELMMAFVRGLAALAPRSLYFDGKQVALNASEEALRNELRLALDPLPEEIVGVYRKLLRLDR